jgi:hypothetical protein
VSQFIFLDQLTRIRPALFNYTPPYDFVVKYLHSSMFEFKPEHFTQTVSATRDFWIHVLKTRIEATIKGEGDMIGWEDDEETNGPNAWRAKRTLQEVVPHLLPEHNDGVLYRLMLEYGDFGIHNTSVTKDDQGNPSSPFLYDWETACIVPALLADPLVAADPVNLIAYSCAEPAASQAPESATATDPENFEAWSKCCFKVGCFIMTMCSSPDMACGSGCTSTFQISKSLSKPAKTFHICGVVLTARLARRVAPRRSLVTYGIGLRTGERAERSMKTDATVQTDIVGAARKVRPIQWSIGTIEHV